VGAGHVEERLVEADPLHEGRVAAEDLEDLGADLAVAGVAARQEQRVRAQAPGVRRRHGREDAVGTGLVRRGRHHAPAARSAHDDGPTPQLRPVEQLDRHEEGVHVDVEDREEVTFAGQVGTGHGAYRRVTVREARSAPSTR
jgi:hypothetical protein